jgi:hypothetical protein
MIGRCACGTKTSVRNWESRIETYAYTTMLATIVCTEIEFKMTSWSKSSERTNAIELLLQKPEDEDWLHCSPGQPTPQTSVLTNEQTVILSKRFFKTTMVFNYVNRLIISIRALFVRWATNRCSTLWIVLFIHQKSRLIKIIIKLAIKGFSFHLTWRTT